MRERIDLAVTVLVMLFLGGAPALAQEYIRDQEPIPDSVDQVVSPIELSFQKEKPKIPRFFPWLKEQLKDTPPFLRDTNLGLNFRTYYLYSDNYPGTSPQINEAWALGGSLSYQSGWFLDHFGVGAVLYTSQPLYAPGDKDGTLLLKPGQEGYTQVGQLYGRVKLFEDNFINIYRYEYNTPYINVDDDSRMTPNTFEGYTFTGAYGGKDGAPGFNYGFGYIDKIKPRNSDRFISMSEAAGAAVTRGVLVGGGKVSYKGITFGAINYYSNDIINIFYTEGSYKLQVTDRLGLLFSAQFTDQRSVGEDLLKGFSFKANQVGVMADASYGGAILTLAYTHTTDGADMQSPWGGYPGYTSVQVQDFNRAGENAFMAKLSYNFARLGLEGVAAYALFVHGWGRVDPSTKDPVPNENEFDADIQWRPQWKFLKGLWFRVRYADVHQYERPKNTMNDFRVIVNYDLALL
ncbi:MAG TPA: OprD family outer membrane porin [Thermodesulfobacteriota bacterium]|jgi:hypothetical protein|nr:OprD family outer membrane porin [Thermodesulfobacteriota bacterium]